MHPAFASVSGRFPENGFWKGMAIEYTIDGVTSPGYIDVNKTKGGGNVNENTRMIDGVLAGTVLDISGTAYANNELPADGASGSMYCQYFCNGDCQSGVVSGWANGGFSLSPGQATPFKLSLPVDPFDDVTRGNVSIQAIWSAEPVWPVSQMHVWALIIDCQFINGTGVNLPRPCDRLLLDLNEETGSVVAAKVVDVCEHKPLKDAVLDIRIFHTYDAQLKKAINGSYVDILPILTDVNGSATIPVNGSQGDIYRVDVYASKEGWDTSDRSIHITIGQGIGTNGNGSGISFNGAWNTDYGTLTLVQDGENVTGEYSHDGGTIKGTVIGNVLKGTWSEAPTHRPPDDAGEIEFQLDPQGTSFTGKWRYGSSGGWTNWNGKLIEEK